MYSNKPQNGIVMNEVRAAFKVINMFRNVDELISFIEETVRSDSKEIPQSLADDRSQYRAFLKLPYDEDMAYSCELTSVCFSIYKMLLDIPKINDMFCTKKYRRFLMHLVVQNGVITDSNSIRMRLASIDPNPANRRDICCQTSLMRHYFRHSCAPNVFNADRDGHGIYITMRPLKKGEKLVVSLYDLAMTSKSERQKLLLSEKHFSCTCIRCAGPYASAELRKQFKSDPLVKNLFANQKDPYDRCVAVLQKYGGGPWFKEIGTVIWILQHELQSRLSGPTNLRAWAEMLAESLSNK